MPRLSSRNPKKDLPTGKDSFALQAPNNNDMLSYLARNYIEWKNTFRETLDFSQKSFLYVCGNSWDETLKKQLLNTGLQAQTINILLPRVLRIWGQESVTRDKIRFVPPPNNHTGVPAIANSVFDWIEYKQDLNEKLSESFLYNIIGDLGGFGEWEWSASDNPMGEPVFNALNSFFVFRDPAFGFNKQDKWRFVGKTWWETPENIIAAFPEKEEEIWQVINPPDKEFEFESLRQQTWGLDGGYVENRDEFINEKQRLFRMIEEQERRKEKRPVAINPKNGKVAVLDNEDQARIMASEFPDLIFDDKHVDRIYTHTSVGDYIYLQSAENEVQNGMFSIIGMGGFEFAEKNIGLIGQTHDQQEGYNKTKSTILHLMHSMASTGWQYEDGALDPEQEENLVKNGSAAGLILKNKQGRPAPTKIQPSIPPNAEWMLANGYVEDLTMITSIGDDQLGQQQFSDQSAKLNEQKVGNSMLTLEPLFRSLKKFKKKVGIYGWDLVKAKMKGPRMLNFLNQNSEPQSIIVNQVVNGQTLNEVTGDHQVMVVPAPDTETQRRQKFAELTTLAAGMPPNLVKWDLVIENAEFMDPQDKSDWMEFINQQQGPPPGDQAEIINSLEFLDEESLEFPQQIG